MTVFVLMLTEIGLDPDNYDNFTETKCIGVFDHETTLEQALHKACPYEWETIPNLRLAWMAHVSPRSDTGVSFASAKAEEWEVQS